jgi:threonine dehydratase
MTRNTLTYSDVNDAASRLFGHAHKTPVLRSEELNKLAGCDLYVKAEALQKGGAFKYRGARNRLSQLTPSEALTGVVAFSSGNHAIGVAISAHELQIPAIIVMPSDAPLAKVNKVKAYGADIRFYDRITESREAIADEIAQQSGRIVVPSFDDERIIAGQGTIGIELAEQCNCLDAVVVCLGGGGMCAGISLALNERSPNTVIYGAEPKDYNDHQHSLASGQREKLVSPPPSICDAILTAQPGKLTWAINSQSLSGVFSVSDEDCLRAMALAKRYLDLRLEPGGAAALASVLTHKPFKPREKVAVIASGGNVDEHVFERALNQI